MKHNDYTVVIQPAPPEDGGGYYALVPDLPGCMSDGETYELAVINVRDAIACWIDAAEQLGRPVPLPSPYRALA
jgi:predicted RNase H-like HicB family nuclease